jgi:fumarate reductase subunit C
VGYFMIRIMKVLLKCYNMAIECVNLLDESITHLVYSINVIHSWWMGVLCVTWHKMIPKSTNLKIRGQD